MTLAVSQLCVDFLDAASGHATRVLDNLSYTLSDGEILAIVGESGCGKSVGALALSGLLPETHSRVSGAVMLDGVDLLKLDAARLRTYRGGRMAYIFQEPSLALNPVIRIGDQILEALELHDRAHANRERVIALLNDVGIADAPARARNYPHELSGGMQQRIMIAMALATAPKILIADEPTTALDVTVQAQILKLLEKLRRQYGMSILLITHNFGLVGELADRVLVLYAGQCIECGTRADVIEHPAHPYTRALLEAVPRIGSSVQLRGIPGRVPPPGNYASNCRFSPRCRCAEKCPQNPAALRECAPGHFVRCVRAFE